MSRPPMPIGTWGKIRRQQVGSGLWRARARFRDYDGTTRDVESSGTTGAAAERSLVEILTQRTASLGEQINADTTIDALGRIWFSEVRNEGRMADSTLDRYEFILLKTVSPALGNVRLRETRVSTVDRFLKTLLADGEITKAGQVKNALIQMFALAVRHDAIAHNPARETVKMPKPARKEVRSLTPEEVQDLRSAARRWDAKPKGGPRRQPNLMSDVVDLMLGTGVRIGELLAIRWSDIDFTNRTLTISGTLIRPKGKPLFRQNWTKTAAGYRAVVLPQFAIDMLSSRLAAQSTRANPHNAVFFTSTGNWLSPDSVRRSWRSVRKGSGFGWVIPHTFRKTVATLIDGEVGSKSAAAQLGQASDSTTHKHYISKPAIAPDMSGVLQQLAGQPDQG